LEFNHDRRGEVMAHDDGGSGASGVILSFLVGALTGAAAAVLLAPRSGRETREMLGDRWRDAAERGRHLSEQAVERSRSALDEASSYVDRQKGALEKRRERLAAAVEAGKQAYREEKEKS
jgi:gas vesicle protein